MATKLEIQQLYNRYLSNEISEKELEEFLQLLHTPENELTVSKLMDGTWEEMFETQETKVIPLYKSTWYKVAAAAVILLLLSTGAYFMFFNKEQKQIAKTEIKNDVAAPKATKAMITLSNGQTIALDSVTSGTLAKQGNINIIKTKDGQIIYNGSASEVVYNTLVNPRGSKPVDITLADGSRVWLNAGSSVTYPVAFVGAERNVELNGEGYFEIAHNASMPFHVKAKDVTVEVLGTHFNVNAYDDENSINATLLEGSIKVTKGTATSVLKPGQQAQVNNSSSIRVISDVNIEETMAWKNGVFQFEGADIKTVMRQIARWYDVDVEYRGNVTQHFRGSISRNVDASKVFQMLELTKAVHFEIVGKKVIVKP